MDPGAGGPTPVRVAAVADASGLGSQADRLARLYLVLSRTNRAVEQAHDCLELLGAACQTVVDAGRFVMCWAGVANLESGRVEPVTWAGREDGYLESVAIAVDGERSKGPTGEAFRGRRTVVCDDIATDPRMVPWREQALAHGFHSSLGLPLFRSGKLFGILTVYGDRPNRFDAAEVELLEELARDISFGLGTLEQTAERHRAEAALNESEARFRTSLETLRDPFVIMRAIRDEGGAIVDFVYEYANAAACAANRLTAEELIGKRVLTLLPEHRKSGLIDSYARVVETGEPLVLDDLDYADSWGGERLERLFDVRASKLGDGLAYTWRDVTERRLAERRRAAQLERRVRERTAELEAARERAFAIAELSATMLEAGDRAQVARGLLDVAARSSGASHGLVALVDGGSGPLEILATLGYPHAIADQLAALPETTASPIRDVVRDGRPIVLGGDERLARRYPELARTIEVLDDDRSRVVFPLWAGEATIGAVSLGFAPRTFDRGDLAFFESLANAAAHALERLRLAEAERQARGMLDAVVAQMPVGVSILERGGQILYRNESLDRIFQSRGPEGGPWNGPGDRSGEALTALRVDGSLYGPDDWPAARSLASGEIVDNEEIAIVRADGSSVAVLQTSAPIKDPTGKVVGAVVVTLDVTARREAEQFRDAFLGVLSHELRTPVTTIYGGAKVLAARGGRLAPSVRDELAADVAAEAERLSRLVDDLLVLARAERGVDLTSRGPALVQHRLRAVVTALATEWPDRRFVCEIPEQVPPVTGDEAYVEQALRNLLGNAAKYGRQEIRARLTVREDGVEVAILDDGPGVAPEAQERIFELFWRATSAKAVPGAGIGLFVARRLVEAMGGQLRVSNRPEGGAAFTLWLPLFLEAGD